MSWIILYNYTTMMGVLWGFFGGFFSCFLELIVSMDGVKNMFLWRNIYFTLSWITGIHPVSNKNSPGTINCETTRFDCTVFVFRYNYNAALL
jgi:hypothetical protein